MQKRKRTNSEKKPVSGYTHIRTKKDISEYELEKNGLRVLYKRVKGTNTVTTNIVYLVGSRHESRGETGITHMLEHMMFKHTGTKKKRDQELGWKKLENLGAQMNATTWLDRTHYFFTLPAKYLDDMLKVEARRMRHLILTDKEFQPERANVLSEYEMYAGNPLVLLESAVNGAAYISHSYGHDTIGHKPDIEQYTIEKLQSYHDTYYWPNNAYLVIVGDVDRKSALESVQSAFGNIRKSPNLIPTVDVQEPTQLGPRRVSVQQKSPINILSINYKSVAGTHKDWAPLYLLMTYLADGKTSVLHQKLVDSHYASAVLQYHLPTHDAFLSGIIAYISKGKTHNEVEEVILNEIEQLKKRLISKKQLTTIKNKIKANELFKRDGGHEIANALTDFIAIGDWTKYFKLLKEIEDVTVEDIKRVAKTYCIDTTKTTGEYIGITK